MRFNEEVVIRILPFHIPNIIRDVYHQLMTGTIIHVEPLADFRNDPGIKCKLRVCEDDDDDKTYYKMTNDERRVLMAKIRAHLFKG